MPIFRYKCDSCGHSFTELKLHSENGNSPKVCEKCGERAVRRVISRVGVVYKGSGFHSTDYGSKTSKASNKEKSADSSDSKADSED